MKPSPPFDSVGGGVEAQADFDMTDETILRADAELISSLYRMVPLIALLTILGSLTVAWALANRVSHQVLGIWVGLNVGFALWRYYLRVRFYRANPGPEDMDKWARLFLIGTAFSGAMWGSTAFLLFVPDSTPYQSIHATALSAICTASMSLLPRYRPALYSFVLLTLLPMAFRLAMQGTGEHLALAAMVVLIVCGVLVFGTEMNATLREALVQRYKNSLLVEQLLSQKEQVEIARQRADQANLSKTRFLASASHDLRQPLHALGLFSAALREKLTDPASREIVGNISMSVEALENQFNALLDISKLDAGAVQAKFYDFRLNDLFDRIRVDFTPPADERGVRLHIRSCRQAVHSDPILVERMLRNLVSNAVRYTRQGGVLVGCRNRGNRVSIEVWDTGIGIAPEEMDRIWEEFYQVGNPERDRQKGLGLGLATVHRLTALLETRVEVDSRPGRGSVFRFELPVATLAEPPALTMPAPVVHSSDDLKGRFVLAIDDETGVRESMKVLFTQWGCDILAAESVDEALERLADFDRYPDVVIADYRLRHGATGVEAIERVRYELGIDLPAVLVTGTAAPESLVDIQGSGLKILYKPVSAAQLREFMLSLHLP
jgi:two-component system, sensor histidine kinase